MMKYHLFYGLEWEESQNSEDLYFKIKSQEAYQKEVNGSYMNIETDTSSKKECCYLSTDDETIKNGTRRTSSPSSRLSMDNSSFATSLSSIIRESLTL